MPMPVAPELVDWTMPIEESTRAALPASTSPPSFRVVVDVLFTVEWVCAMATPTAPPVVERATADALAKRPDASVKLLPAMTRVPASTQASLLLVWSLVEDDPPTPTRPP